MIKSCETSYLYVVIANGITAELCGKSLRWHTITGTQSSVVIPLRISNLCHNFLSLGSLLLFENNIFLIHYFVFLL